MFPVAHSIVCVRVCGVDALYVGGQCILQHMLIWVYFCLMLKGSSYEVAWHHAKWHTAATWIQYQ